MCLLSSNLFAQEEKEGEELKTILSKFGVALAGSPILARAVAIQLSKFNNDNVQRWARESYYLVDQIVAAGEESGLLKGQTADRTKLFKDQFGRILDEAGWLEKTALRASGKNDKIFQKAAAAAERTKQATFHGEVARLKAAGAIGNNAANALLDIRNRGDVTCRELGALLLRRTELRSPEILELMRTYDPSWTVPTARGRDCPFGVTVLELYEPWRDRNRAFFKSQISKESVANLLEFQGNIDDFTRMVMKEGDLAPGDAKKLVDTFNKEYIRDSHLGKTQKKKKSQIIAPWPVESEPIKRAKQSLRSDLVGGGLLSDVAITATISLFSRASSGHSLSQSLSDTVSLLTSSEFIFGDLLGGTIGATLGAMIPLPASLVKMGFLGKVFGSLPSLTLAIAGAQIGYNAISLAKKGEFSLSALFASLDICTIIGQGLGGSIGAVLGSIFLPGPVGAIIGGVLGGLVGTKIASLFSTKKSEERPQELLTVGQQRSSRKLSTINGELRRAYQNYIRAQQQGDRKEATKQFKIYSKLCQEEFGQTAR